jgi:hypothetical protein
VQSRFYNYYLIMKKLPLKPMDIPVIVLAVILTLIVAGAAYSDKTSSLRVIIKSSDKTWIYPLDAEERVYVDGSIGVTIVEIHGNKAAVVSSPCGGQTCVAAGGLHKNGQWAACLPNRVFLLVEGAKETDAIDAATW